MALNLVNEKREEEIRLAVELGMIELKVGEECVDIALGNRECNVGLELNRPNLLGI